MLNLLPRISQPPIDASPKNYRGIGGVNPGYPVRRPLGPAPALRKLEVGAGAIQRGVIAAAFGGLGVDHVAAMA